MDSTWTRELGVALTGPESPRRVVEWARAAEAAGLGSLWFVEDYFQTGAFSLAAAAAAVTDRVAIGLGVVNPYTRHPAVLAMETQALAQVARGRLVVGLGTSNRRWIEEQMGIPFKLPLGTMAECADVLRRLWRGERVTHDGHAFALRDVALEFAGDGSRPPIFLGVKGPKALQLAAEIADGVHCSILSSPGHVRRVRETIRELPVIAYVGMGVSRDGRLARDAARPFVARYVALLHGQSILTDAGVPPALSQEIRDARRHGSAAELVPDSLIDRLAVAGTPDECGRALRRWADAGLDAPIAVPLPGLDVMEQLAAFGELAVAWREITGPRGATARRDWTGSRPKQEDT